MNRYTAAGILADMRHGKRILVVTDSMTGSRANFNDMTPLLREGEGQRRANGQEHISAREHDGCILFRSWGQIKLNALRGLAMVDTVFFDMDAHVEIIDRVRQELCGLPVEVIRR